MDKEDEANLVGSAAGAAVTKAGMVVAAASGPAAIVMVPLALFGGALTRYVVSEVVEASEDD